MNVGTVLLVILVLALFGVLPIWPHQGFGYGYYPSGLVTVLVIVLILWLLGVFGSRP